MGILRNEYNSADFDPGGYGFIDFEDALNSIDHDEPPLLSTFKIDGEIYILIEKNGELEFEEYEDE